MSSLKNLPEKSHSEPHRGKHKGEDILPSSAKNDSACAAHGHTDHRQQMNDGPGGGDWQNPKGKDSFANM